MADLPDTTTLYYDDQDARTFEAVVLDVLEAGDHFEVVLDQTLFYPEGGGQPADHGTIVSDERTATVSDVQRRDGVIFHITDTDPGKGEFVRGSIDAQRRRRLMQHHSATHIVGHAARQVLGDHVRQAGAQKGTDRARLDLTHFERIDREDVAEIERIANELVRMNERVVSEWPHRTDAEAEYGFDLYQGGLPTGEHIRIIKIEDDIQACGGTHVSRTGEIGLIKIIGAERIQDGVERLSFAAGHPALETVQRTDDLLYETARTLDVNPNDVPATARRFFEEWKARGKEIDALQEDLAEARVGANDGEEVDLAGATAIVRRLDGDVDELRATANAISEAGQVAVLGSGADGAQFVVAVPDDVTLNAGRVVSGLAERVGGGGGGPPDFAQGGGPRTDALDDALADAPDLLRKALDA